MKDLRLAGSFKMRPDSFTAAALPELAALGASDRKLVVCHPVRLPSERGQWSQQPRQRELRLEAHRGACPVPYVLARQGRSHEQRAKGNLSHRLDRSQRLPRGHGRPREGVAEDPIPAVSGPTEGGPYGYQGLLPRQPHRSEGKVWAILQGLVAGLSSHTRC